MSENKRIAVLIDAENVPAVFADQIFETASVMGRIMMKEMYGSGPALCSWTEPALRYVIRPNITLRQTKGKNTSDIALTIGAMDLLIADIADTVVIVSSDSDFSALAIRLRTAGKNVVGMGEVKSNAMWKVACTEFITLEQKPASMNQPAEKVQKVRKKEEKPVQVEPEPEIDIEQEALAIVRADKDTDGFVTVNQMIQTLKDRFPGILPGKRVFDKAVAMFEGMDSIEVRKSPRPGRRGGQLIAIREKGTGLEEEAIVDSEEKTQETVRNTIIRALEEKNGRMPISALFPMLSDIPGYRAAQKRSGKKPQQYLIDMYGDLFATEDINGGLWAIPLIEAAEAQEPEEIVAVEETVPVEMEQEVPTQDIPEETAEQVPEEISEPDPAAKLCTMLIAAGWDIETADSTARIMTENSRLKAYNKMRKEFGGTEGSKYYNAAKVMLDEIK